MATKTMDELQTAEEAAKSKYEEDVGTPGAGVGLALMGFGMGVTGKGGQFQQIVERKKEAVRQRRREVWQDAVNQKRELQAKQERDRDRAIAVQRHNDSIKMQTMTASINASKAISEMIAKRNFKGAENLSVVTDEKLKTGTVRYYKNKDGKDVVFNFPTGMDSKAVMGMINAGDPKYNVSDKNIIGVWDDKDKTYKSIGVSGTLADAYMLGGVDDTVGKGVITVIDKDGKTRVVSRKTAVEEGLEPVKSSSNLATGQVYVSSLSPERQKFAKENYGLGENGVIDVKMLNQDYIKSKRNVAEGEVDAEKDKMKFESKLETTNTALNNVNEALDIVNSESLTSSGIFGQALSFIESTDAGTLESHYDTLRAIMAFGNLSGMREASKTGGALGNVTEMELRLLSSETAKLSAGLPTQKQADNLGKVQDKYIKILVKSSFGNEAESMGFKKPFRKIVDDTKGWVVMDRFVTDDDLQRSLGETTYNRMKSLLK